MSKSRPKTINNEPSLTQQHQASQVDIKSIMARARLTGSMPQPTSKLYYGDFTENLSYQECLNKVISAQSAFQSLPAKIRDRFQNDPQQLLSFLADNKNHAEAVKLGIVKENVPVQETPKETPKT